MERQKAMLNVSGKHKSSEEMNGSRVSFPYQRVENGKPKKLKLSIPSDVASTTKVTKVEDHVSLTAAIAAKIQELTAPKVVERNLSENSPGWQQAHQTPTVKKQDLRVPVGPRFSAAKARDKNLSNLDEIGNRMQGSPRARPVKVENAELISHKVADERSKTLSKKGFPDLGRLRKQFSKEEDVIFSSSTRLLAPKILPDASRYHQASEAVSAIYKNVANMKQDSKSPAVGLERKCQSIMPDDLKEAYSALPNVRKLSTPNQVRGDEDVSPNLNRNRRFRQGNWNGTGESRVKHGSFLSSKRAGLSSEGSRRAEVVSHIASKKRPGSEVEVGTQNSKTLRHSDSQPIEAEAQQVPEGLKLQKVGAIAVSGVSAKKQSDQTKSVKPSRLPTQGLANKVANALVKNNRISAPGAAAQNHSRAAALDGTVAPPEEQGQEPFEPKKKIFNFPWEETLLTAQDGKALFLQNLDPWFSSSEIEANLQDLLRVSCDVRMLPPKNFSCYASGQALVLFRTLDAAEKALVKLTENFLIWSKDDRPVLASLADAKIAVDNRICGFYNAQLAGSWGTPTACGEQKVAVAPSHCSQANTVEYEMGIEWRLLQDRHAEAWAIAAEDEKVAIDKSS